MTFKHVTSTFNDLMEDLWEIHPNVKIKLYQGEESEFAVARQMAYTELHGGKLSIVVSAKLERQPNDVVVGIMAHEIAHAVDMLLGQKKLEAWHGKLPATPEARADALAKKLFGFTIRYDANEVETIGPGGPRPKHLPR